MKPKKPNVLESSALKMYSSAALLKGYEKRILRDAQEEVKERGLLELPRGAVIKKLRAEITRVAAKARKDSEKYGDCGPLDLADTRISIIGAMIGILINNGRKI